MAWSLIHNVYTLEERPLIGLGHRLDTIRHAGASARQSSKRFAPLVRRGGAAAASDALGARGVVSVMGDANLGPACARCPPGQPSTVGQFDAGS